ncbi:hypothetical protein C0993_002416, partial [Termitomyces sp. T159_Od127]
MDYKAERTRLAASSYAFETADIDAERTLGLSADAEPPRPAAGLKHYWSFRNAASVDGLPGMLTAHHSRTTFLMPERLKITKHERIHDSEGAAWLDR